MHPIARALLVVLAAVVAYRFYNAPLIGVLHYILMSPPLDSPDLPVPPSNVDLEVENGVRHRFVHVGRTLDGRDTDVTYHFIETGYDQGKEAVVFVPGFPETSEAFRYQLRNLQDQFHCIAVDLKGFGQSSKPYSNIIYPELNETGGDYERSAVSAELVTALDSMGVRQFNLVGTDLGGWYTHILAGDWASRILRYASVQISIAVNIRRAIPQAYLLRNLPRAFVSMFESRPLGLAEYVIGALDTSRWLLPGCINTVRVRNPVEEETVKALKRGVMHKFTHGPSAGKPSAYHAWAAFL